MADQPDLIIVDRAKLDKFLTTTFPHSPSVRADIIDEWIVKPTPRGVTPNRQDRGSSIVKMAIRMSKMMDMPLDTILEMLVRTTDVWDQRTQYMRELIGAYRQIKQFLGEQLEAKQGMASFPREDEEAMQRTIFELTWKLQDLEDAERIDAEQREQIRNG